MEAVLLNFNGVTSGSKVEFVIGDRRQSVIDDDSGVFGVGCEGKKASTLDGSILDVGSIPFGELDGHGGTDDQNKYY